MRMASRFALLKSRCQRASCSTASLVPFPAPFPPFTAAALSDDVLVDCGEASAARVKKKEPSVVTTRVRALVRVLLLASEWKHSPSRASPSAGPPQAATACAQGFAAARTLSATSSVPGVSSQSMPRGASSDSIDCLRSRSRASASTDCGTGKYTGIRLKSRRRRASPMHGRRGHVRATQRGHECL